tara:strand:- start:4017 stop:4652 length:636 start_codon:yes stop_codon:yes gene_type:complete
MAFSLMVFAQSQSGKGVVILNNEEVIFGKVVYHQEYEMVSVTQNGRELAYNATQVKLFQYYDQEKSLNRIYRPFKESSTYRYSNFKTPEFFELVLMEEILIMRKQKKILIEPLERSDKGSILAKNLYSAPKLAIDYDYYYSQDGQSSHLINDFQEQIIPLFEERHITLINRFIDNEKVNLKEWAGQYKVLVYYKELKEKVPESTLVSQSNI